MVSSVQTSTPLARRARDFGRWRQYFTMDTHYPTSMAYDVKLGRCQKRNLSQLSHLAEYRGLTFQRAKVLNNPKSMFYFLKRESCGY
jgi:hypothetical protein